MRSTSTRSTKLWTSSSGPFTNDGSARPHSSSSASVRSMRRASSGASTPAAASARLQAMLPVTSSSKSRRSKRKEAPNSKAAASGAESKRPDHSVLIGLHSWIVDARIDRLARALEQLEAHDAAQRRARLVDVRVERFAMRAEPLPAVDRGDVLARDERPEARERLARGRPPQDAGGLVHHLRPRRFETVDAPDAVRARENVEAADQIGQPHRDAVERGRRAARERDFY